MNDLSNMPTKVKIISMTGPSGSGKTTIAKALMKLFPEIVLIVSCTIRARRPNDLPGEYSYLSQEEFNGFREDESFLWTVAAHGNLYGTLRRSVDEALQRRWPSTIFVTPNAVQNLLSYAHDQVKPFFIVPPREEVLRERLTLRGDKLADIEKRITDCRDWTKEARSSRIPYVYIDNSGDVDKAAQEMARSLPELARLA